MKNFNGYITIPTLDGIDSTGLYPCPELNINDHTFNFVLEQRVDTYWIVMPNKTHNTKFPDYVPTSLSYRISKDECECLAYRYKVQCSNIFVNPTPITKRHITNAIMELQI